MPAFLKNHGYFIVWICVKIWSIHIHFTNFYFIKFSLLMYLKSFITYAPLMCWIWIWCKTAKKRTYFESIFLVIWEQGASIVRYRSRDAKMDSTISPAANTTWQQYSKGWQQWHKHQNIPIHLVPVVSSVGSLLRKLYFLWSTFW